MVTHDLRAPGGYGAAQVPAPRRKCGKTTPRSHQGNSRHSPFGALLMHREIAMHLSTGPDLGRHRQHPSLIARTRKYQCKEILQIMPVDGGWQDLMSQFAP